MIYTSQSVDKRLCFTAEDKREKWLIWRLTILHQYLMGKKIPHKYQRYQLICRQQPQKTITQAAAECVVFRVLEYIFTLAHRSLMNTNNGRLSLGFLEILCNSRNQIRDKIIPYYVLHTAVSLASVGRCFLVYPHSAEYTCLCNDVSQMKADIISMFHVSGQSHLLSWGWLSGGCCCLPRPHWRV